MNIAYYQQFEKVIIAGDFNGSENLKDDFIIHDANNQSMTSFAITIFNMCFDHT